MINDPEYHERALNTLKGDEKIMYENGMMTPSDEWRIEQRFYQEDARNSMYESASSSSSNSFSYDTNNSSYSSPYESTSGSSYGTGLGYGTGGYAYRESDSKGGIVTYIVAGFLGFFLGCWLSYKYDLGIFTTGCLIYATAWILNRVLCGLISWIRNREIRKMERERHKRWKIWEKRWKMEEKERKKFDSERKKKKSKVKIIIIALIVIWIWIQFFG